MNKFVYKIASFLFNHFIFLYRPLYFRYKRKYDTGEIKFLRTTVKPGDTVLDIGANIGFYTCLLSDLVGAKGHVYAFEPDVRNFGYLKQTAGERKNVHLNNIAVSDTQGVVDFYLSEDLNVDHRIFPFPGAKTKYSVPADSIDHFVSGKFKIDFIKMDIQGGEMLALKGMENTLKDNEHIVIVTELFPHGLKYSNTSSEELFGFFKKQNFNVYLMSGSRLEAFPSNPETLFRKDTNHHFYNIVLSRRSLLN